MRVAVVSTYPPRPCGIGTFTSDLRCALREADPAAAVDVVAVVREHGGGPAQDVVQVIRQDIGGDYVEAARAVASRGADVVLLEHEYGIFGGEAGAFVLSLVRELRQPLVVTLHTVLSSPSVAQAETVRALCARASLVMVFTETARRMVVEARLASPERVRVVPHGAPTVLTEQGAAAGTAAVTSSDPGASDPVLSIASERLVGRTVLSTFGLISSGKGIEVAIRCLPAVVARHPEVVYLVAGQTHPEVVMTEGESYRRSLEQLVDELGLRDHVLFVDRFLTDAELARMLGSTAVYLTPYRSREQIVSGALTFAVAAGCAVVSTPYYYAEDLLKSGAGRLVPFDDPDAFGDAVLALLDDPAALTSARDEARRVGSGMSWPAVGAQTLVVLAEAVELGPVAEDSIARTPPLALSTAFGAASAPRLRPDHLLTLVDDVGIVQHADGVVPNRDSGYCTDDVARLVIVSLGMDRGRADTVFSRLLTLGLSFLRHAWDPTGEGMRNFMSYDRRWLDDAHDGDHVGRAAWALGEVLADLPPRAVAVPTLRLLEELSAVVERMRSPRGVAYAVIGLSRPASDALPEQLVKLMQSGADHLAMLYAATSRDGWHWFENVLSYDNARLPQALLAAGHRLGDDALVRQGLEALDWYTDQCTPDTQVVRLVGNGWRRPDQLPRRPREGDEQPVDAAALVEAHVEAYLVTGDQRYGHRAVWAFEWFLGRNHLGMPVFDLATGGCHDGLGEEALNDNEGAESTLAFMQALLALERAGLQASLPRMRPGRA